MTISSSPPLIALQAERAHHATQMSEVAKVCRAQSAALSKALNSLRNECVELDRSTAERFKSEGLVDQEAALRKDLKQTRCLKDEQPLRLKGDTRIVPMQSRSLVKRLLGIGQAKREVQAAALTGRHGLSAHAVTRELLKDTLSGIQAKKNAIRDGILQSHSHELQAIFVTAARLATLDGMEPQKLDAYAERALGRLSGHSNFTEAFEREREDLRATQDSERKARLTPLHQRRRELEVQLGALAQQEKKAARSGLLAAAGVTAGVGTRELQQKLKVLKDECKFSAVYHTNAGCKAIQGLLEGRPVSVSPSAIIEEIRRVHGEDAFGRGAATEKAALKEGAARLTQSMAAQVNDACHALALAEFREGTRNYVTTYRQAQHSEGMVARLRDMAGTNGLLRPTRFLSTADNRDEILAFPVDRHARMHCVQFTIDGFSAMKTGSPWRMAGEGQERLYSTHSCFRVDSVRKDGAGIWQVKLREQPVNADHRPDSLLVL